MIQGYDEWKTSPPEDPPIVGECINCGDEFFEGEEVYTDCEESLYCSVKCVFEGTGIDTITLF